MILVSSQQDSQDVTGQTLDRSMSGELFKEITIFLFLRPLGDNKTNNNQCTDNYSVMIYFVVLLDFKSIFTGNLIIIPESEWKLLGR